MQKPRAMVRGFRRRLGRAVRAFRSPEPRGTPEAKGSPGADRSPAEGTPGGRKPAGGKHAAPARPAGAGAAAPGTGLAPVIAPDPIIDVERRVPRAERLVPSPVFILGSMRSGSTLLRMLLNSHSQIRAPHELHLQTTMVSLKPEFSERSMDALGLDRPELEHMLWDRIFDRELRRTGKRVFVEKTPGNAWLWRRLHDAWPEARFIVLLRHPAAVLTSAYVPKDQAKAERHVLKYARPIEEARANLPGAVTVRYEELTADPAAETRRLCEWLGLDWEESMLDYGEHDQGPLAAHLGDRSAKIRSGQIAEARTVPEGAQRIVSAELRAIATAWGYR